MRHTTRLVILSCLGLLGARAQAQVKDKQEMRDSAQEAGHARHFGYPARNEVISALKDADYAFRRFQEVTGRVNFSGWKVEHESVDAAQQLLEATLGQARLSIDRIDLLQAGKSVSAFDLFEIYRGLVGASAAASDLESDIERFQRGGGALATDFANIDALIVKTSGKIRVVLWAQIQAEESELEACRQQLK